MAKIRKKKLKNKRLGNFFRCPEGQRTERQGTGSRCTAAPYRTGRNMAERGRKRRRGLACFTGGSDMLLFSVFMNMGNRLYHDKRPRERRLIPREHYCHRDGERGWKPKQAFENEASADNYIESRRYFRDNNYCSYQCTWCGKWHIGRLNENE